MPHIFIDRPRVFDFGLSVLNRQFTSQRAHAALYEIGGLLFILGSILFFPCFDQYKKIGTCMFLSGSSLYGIVNTYNLIETIFQIKNQKQVSTHDKVQLLTAIIFVLGTLCFISASLNFLLVGTPPGGVFLMIGSLFFFTGSLSNMLSSAFSSASIVQVQITNITSTSFVLGSMLFFLAAIPMTWGEMSPSVEALVAGQFVGGSVLFLNGGVFSYGREKYLLKGAMYSQQAEALDESKPLINDGDIEDVKKVRHLYTESS